MDSPVDRTSSTSDPASKHRAVAQAASETTHWPARWPAITIATGLQGKLVLCVMFLLTMTLGASCWLFVNQTRETFDRIAGDQARQLARTLAMASLPALEREDVADLQRIGADLMKNRGLVAVGFFDSAGKQVATASRDPEVENPIAGFFRNPKENPAELSELAERSTPSLGRYVELTTPVVRPAGRFLGQPATPRAGGIAGYVTVCLSQSETDSRVRNVTLLVLLIGAVAVLVSLPTMYLLVHRIFGPIRQLVAATDRIAGGDLDTRVAIDRPDVIGTLARSFNQMINKVRQQQEELERTNGDLAKANWKLARANTYLEEQVKTRTAELEKTNRRLRSEMADKDDFLRTVSHDLNAPLRNIAGMASILLMKHRESFDPDIIHRLERIQKNVEIETDLIAELLELSRIKSRRQRFEEVAVADVIREVNGLFAQDLETRGITLIVDTAMPRVVCERSRLRQVFQNLIDNAIKYMGEGSQADKIRSAGHIVEGNAERVREIHVGCTSADHAEPVLEFYLRDTGIGIDPSEVDNVFRVFRRGKSLAVQAVAGKGVGLASVKSIIETYGGTIAVESAIGVGSLFRFTIDARQAAQSAAAAAAESASANQVGVKAA